MLSSIFYFPICLCVYVVIFLELGIWYLELGSYLCVYVIFFLVVSQSLTEQKNLTEG